MIPAAVYQNFIYCSGRFKPWNLQEDGSFPLRSDEIEQLYPLYYDAS